MELNHEILKKALFDLKEIHGVSRTEATKESGVHNLHRIISGEIAPLAESWWKLHQAFPKYIPEPTYTDGKVVYQPSQNISAKSSTVNQAGNDLSINENITSSDKELIKLLIEYGDEEIKTKLKGMLIKKITEKLN